MHASGYDVACGNAGAGRTGEIGTLRTLGFPRRSILWDFVLEALFLGLLGGLIPGLRAARIKIVGALMAA